jgi:hypothetical protein
LAERPADPARRLGFLARLGHFSRGLVYVAMGVLAARALLLSRVLAAGPEEALRAIVHGPHGRTIVALIAGGLFADALFRAIEALDRRRSRLERLGRWGRAGGAALLGATALRVERHLRDPRAGDGFRGAILWLLRQAWGPRALIGAGVIALIVALLEIVQGATGRFREGFRRKGMSRFQKTWASRITRAGLVAHGALIGAIGAYGIRAGVEANARDVVDSATALRRISSLPFGTALAAGIAGGLVAYGLSQWVLALYRKA